MLSNPMRIDDDECVLHEQQRFPSQTIVDCGGAFMRPKQSPQ
jgi:hypothetical protein